MFARTHQRALSALSVERVHNRLAHEVHWWFHAREKTELLGGLADEHLDAADGHRALRDTVGEQSNAKAPRGGGQSTKQPTRKQSASSTHLDSGAGHARKL